MIADDFLRYAHAIVRDHAPGPKHARNPRWVGAGPVVGRV